VGTSTQAYVPLLELAGPFASRLSHHFCNIGKANAAVFPEPVLATPITSLSLSAIGIDWV
jgi:hypothetical protein